MWFQNFFIVLSLNCVLGVNILHIANLPSPSHHIWNRALAFALAEKGHNITYLGILEDKKVPENYHAIIIEAPPEENFDQELFAQMSALSSISLFVDFCRVACRHLLHTQALKKLLEYPKDYKFDAIIIDITMGPCMYPLIAKFNYPPTIAVTPFLLPTYVSFSFGNHLFPSYIPWYGLPYSKDMSFIQRVWNTILTYLDTWSHMEVQYKNEREDAKEIFGNDIPSFHELERHISLVLSNTDPILDRPQVLSPNIIPVGGLHTRKPQKLPEDLQKIADGAKNGIIVFSLGSNVRSDKLNKNIQKTLFEAFREIPETVIWKFESDNKDLPENVIIRKWLPQGDLLGHPNVKVFIGHCGALSTQESVYHGVPILCVPFFMDQLINSKNIIQQKFGISLDFRKITKKYFLDKLNEIRNNPIYSNNVKRASKIFNDRKETPLETGVSWVEFVIKHGGADFLNTPARDLPYYVSSGLDVLAFLFTIVLIVFTLIYKIIAAILKSLQGKKKVKVN